MIPTEKNIENGKDGIKKAIEKHLDHKNKEVVLKNSLKKVYLYDLSSKFEKKKNY